MRRRPALVSLAVLLAHFLPQGWCSAFAPDAAENVGSGCTAADETSRLRCQLEEAKTLLRWQSLVIETKNAQLEQNLALMKEKNIELEHTDAVIQEKDIELAPGAMAKATEFQLSQKEDSHTALDWKDGLMKDKEVRKDVLIQERHDYPAFWHHDKLSKRMVVEEYSDRQRHGRLRKYTVEKDRRGRLLAPTDLPLATTDLPTIIAALPTNTTNISLRSRGVTGTLPADLGRLVHLEYLDLSDNNIEGTMPPELGNLTRLTYLNLCNNGLSGTLPAELWRLIHLEYLDVSNQMIEGTLPADLGRLTHLKYLSVSWNDFIGTIPPELGNLTQLTSLDLGNPLLTGSIPKELGKLVNLKILVLGPIYWSGVGLTGTVPAELGQLVQLTTFNLRNLQLEGTIPSWLDKMSQLTILNLKCSGLAGSIPKELGNLANLNILELGNYGCNYAPLTGTLPTELAQLVNLTTLGVAYNQLEGTIPSWLAKLTQLTQLDMESCGLTGTVPAELGHLKQLTSLNLAFNQLEGTIPSGLGNLTQLTQLILKSSGLTGTLPSNLGRLVRLEDLSLQENQITGTLPAELGNLVRLRFLYLKGNRLTGTVPPELGKLAHLLVMRLDFNKFTGTIPSELSNLTQLLYLGFSANRFTGAIPPGLGKLTNVWYLGLDSNMLDGTIPLELSNLAQLEYLGLFANELEGTIPPELANLTVLSYLGLDSNRLEGTVPPDLGNLAELTTLNLASNGLTGTIPPELGRLMRLSYMGLDGNRLTGTIPPDLGKLQRLSTCRLDKNRLTGQLPKELGSLVRLSTFNLAGNLFSGTLPAAIVQLQALTTLDVSDNPFLTGTFPDTTNSNLRSIVAVGCSFTSGGAVGDSVKTMSFASNNLTYFPATWANLPGVLHLDVSNNHISEWRPWGVPPTAAFSLGSSLPQCGRLILPLERRLNWPAIQSVNLSGNPFGLNITLRDFVMSLSYLHSLSELYAAGCNLQGVVPLEAAGDAFGFDVDNTGPDCNQKIPAGYQGLLTLDLSDNNITAIMPPPPQRLSTADLHGNPLVELHAAWYHTPSLLEVWNSSFLRADVTLPSRGTGCLTGGATTLEADPLGFVTESGEDAFQCTTLCPGVRTRYKHDAALNISSLCRCTAGRQGASANCTGCPADTYSDAEDQWAMVRTCRPCPERSSTDHVENATTVDQCKCAAGWYMEMSATGQGAANATTSPACKRCKQGRFMDSEPGSTKEAQCLCNASYAGLRFLLGVCGCADGLYMDNLALACRRCNAVAEECTWGSAIELSLLPPVVKASYWAAPPPAASDFSKHDIWRCVSKDTCLGNGTCAVGRYGTACSLCAEGMYGGPDGPCKPCSDNPEDSRKKLLYGLLVGQGATIAAHTLLSLGGSGLASTASTLRTSGKQTLKFLQMLGLMAGFNIRWPPLALKFLTEVSLITVALPRVAGVACLSGQQTATLEMVFRWLMPVAGLFSVCFSALVLAPIRLLGRESRYCKFAHMGYWDVLRVSLWGLALFYSTLLQFGTQVLTCLPGPNGKRTVMTFPHLECSNSGEWAQLAAMSFAFLLVFVGAVFLGIYTAWRRATRALVESNFLSSGWWGFLFDDYRNGWGHWLMVTMAKDAALVAIVTAGASDGPSQLLATAAVSIVYSYVVLRDQPFQNPSNNVLEAWTMMSVAVISVFTAGMGFQSVPGADIAELYIDGSSDPGYRRRERSLLAVQCFTFAGPAGVMLYQLLCMSDKARNRLPAFLRPATEEERSKWNKEFLTSLKLDEATAPDLWGVMHRFDVVDNTKFRDFMSTSTATLGVVPSNASGINVKRIVRKRFMDVARSTNSQLLSSSSSLPNAGMSFDSQVLDALAEQAQEDKRRDLGDPAAGTAATHADDKSIVTLGVAFEEQPGPPERTDREPASHQMWASSHDGKVVVL